MTTENSLGMEFVEILPRDANGLDVPGAEDAGLLQNPQNSVEPGADHRITKRLEKSTSPDIK
jgi:hypothetical protein